MEFDGKFNRKENDRGGESSRPIVEVEGEN